MHTPGPWLIVEGDEWTNDIATNIPGQGIWNVASVNKLRDEYKANKYLIAAAPELLAALEDAYRHLEYWGYGDSWERECAMSLGLPRQIERVIAKAKGELK